MASQITPPVDPEHHGHRGVGSHVTRGVDIEIKAIFRTEIRANGTPRRHALRLRAHDHVGQWSDLAVRRVQRLRRRPAPPRNRRLGKRDIPIPHRPLGAGLGTDHTGSGCDRGIRYGPVVRPRAGSEQKQQQGG